MLQLMTTLSYGLVACTPCLSCQATQHCGFKTEIAMQYLRHQSKHWIPSVFDCIIREYRSDFRG